MLWLRASCTFYSLLLSILGSVSLWLTSASENDFSCSGWIYRELMTHFYIVKASNIRFCTLANLIDTVSFSLL